MGTGKTRTTLTIIDRMQARLVLVCCPLAVVDAWAKQAGLWAPGREILLLNSGTGAAKAKRLATALAAKTPLIVVVNYESAHRLAQLKEVKWDAIVWDEVHRLKAPSGVASKWARKLAKANKQAKIIGLTGTLIPHSILDAWAIYLAMDDLTFGDSFVLHRTRYAIMNPRVRGMVVGWKNLPQAHQLIASTTHHVKSSEVLDLPEIQFIDIQTDLTQEESRLYVEIEKEFCAICKDGTVTTQNALTQLLRLQQICGGYVKFDDDAATTRICPHPAKQARLRDMLEDLPRDEPFVIFCRFRSDIEAAKEACVQTGRTVSELSGEARELKEWQDGQTDVLVTQIQSGGIGIDLTRASYACFYSLGYNLAEYEQAVARLHRPGQLKRTIIYHLTATRHGRKTCDGRVYEALSQRKEVIDELISGYRNTAVVGA